MSEAIKSVKKVAVIMAGGSGERFWPLSRAQRPKQLLKLTSPDQTLLEEAVNRIAQSIPREDIFISTMPDLVEAIKEAGPNVPDENILAEPCKRNTAGCLCWVAAELRAKYGPDVNVAMAILTADHQIGAPELFLKQVDIALEAAVEFNSLVTIGIKPTRPETGYGYIEAGSPTSKDSVLMVDRFREKPNHLVAEEFLYSRRHYWNSGMFFWTISTFLGEMEKASPLHAQVTTSIAKSLAEGNKDEAEAQFKRLPNISIDYALMEKASRVLMVMGDFPWDDVGAWDALGRSREKDEHENVIEGNCIVLNSKDSIVVNEVEGKRMVVGVTGVEHLVVIVSEDAVLVTTKNSAQDVRWISRKLKEDGAPQV